MSPIRITAVSFGLLLLGACGECSEPNLLADGDETTSAPLTGELAIGEALPPSEPIFSMEAECPNCLHPHGWHHWWGGWHWGNFEMPQHLPYIVPHQGYYYFRPYHIDHIPMHQELVARWGGDPRNPYANEVFEHVYEAIEATEREDSTSAGADEDLPPAPPIEEPDRGVSVEEQDSSRRRGDDL